MSFCMFSRVTSSKKPNAKNHKMKGWNAAAPEKQTVISSDDANKADRQIDGERMPTSCFVKSMALIARDDNIGKRSNNERKAKKVINI